MINNNFINKNFLSLNKKSLNFCYSSTPFAFTKKRRIFFEKASKKASFSVGRENLLNLPIAKTI